MHPVGVMMTMFLDRPNPTVGQTIQKPSWAGMNFNSFGGLGKAGSFQSLNFNPALQLIPAHLISSDIFLYNVTVSQDLGTMVDPSKCTDSSIGDVNLTWFGITACV